MTDEKPFELIIKNPSAFPVDIEVLEFTNDKLVIKLKHLQKNKGQYDLLSQAIEDSAPFLSPLHKELT